MTDKKEKELKRLREEYTFRKSNALVQRSRYSLSLPEQRLVNFVCTMINPDEVGADGKPYQLEYVINFRDYCQVCGLDTDGNKVYEELKNAFDTLRSKCIWIPDDDKDIGGCEEQVSWFSKVKINKRSAKVKLDESLAPFLFHVLKSFTQFQMIDILGMRSAYSMHLYEILASHAFKGKAVLDLFELKRCLMIVDKKGKPIIASYQRFSNFSQKVLDPAIKEINERTPITVSYSTIKEGRKVAQLVFHIERKDPVDRYKAACATIQEMGEIGHPVKRGIGRPKQKPAEPAAAAPAPDPVLALPAPAPAEVADQPVKKGRGRPRKTPAPAVS